MRPLDHKLKYQIDKLVRTAITGSLGETGVASSSNLTFNLGFPWKIWFRSHVKYQTCREISFHVSQASVYNLSFVCVDF